MRSYCWCKGKINQSSVWSVLTGDWGSTSHQAASLFSFIWLWSWECSRGMWQHVRKWNSVISSLMLVEITASGAAQGSLSWDGVTATALWRWPLVSWGLGVCYPWSVTKMKRHIDYSRHLPCKSKWTQGKCIPLAFHMLCILHLFKCPLQCGNHLYTSMSFENE